MITDALEFVSAETSQTRVDLRPLATSSLFSRASLPDLVNGVAQSRHVDFEFSIENQSVMGDEKLIRNVFRRLAHNASKFASAGTHVIVTGASIDGRYRVSIENRGVPLDEARIAQLMKPFTLNENALNHSVGTGLGLPISLALLKLHGSTLRFHSEGDQVIVSFDLALA
jgi:signal transduction histidine kinase